MKELIIESKGIKTGQYFIPPFELREGELVIIYLQGGAHFDNLKIQLTAIFTGSANHENVKIFKPLTFAESFKESKFKRMFNPTTVFEHLKRNADSKSILISRIFEIDSFTGNDKVKNLDTSQKKRLSLSAVFSKTKNIVFDLRGESPVGAQKTFQFVKDEIKEEGAAILIDWAEDMKKDCSKFIEIEWLADLEELKKIGNGSVNLSRMY
ncbi:hypothetical protein C8C83_2257 [Flavobacterium sp. 90]|uniref:hypothetical protein n=1 Tax=unclassified Flavobacterium TaxID=196869 RepID=UPI000EB3AC60|nr:MULTISPECIES: hypothetical protein [unclassified Flavobacterium]RKR10580.1 hypothetical protein C8C82_2561 [Flavobacterium sp. 81]TCK54364.1 hypothetical protein C8C83_2257 [Flavobacterium sp. 90]